jgi:PadR family transcriptional regulator PadR
MSVAHKGNNRRVSNPSFLNGVPELLILTLLGSCERYGYELIQGISKSTNNGITFGEGVIYPALRQLERNGMLTCRSRLVMGRTRIYYRVTSRGKSHLLGLTRRWRHVTKAVNAVLEGD